MRSILLTSIALALAGCSGCLAPACAAPDPGASLTATPIDGGGDCGPLGPDGLLYCRAFPAEETGACEITRRWECQSVKLADGRDLRVLTIDAPALASTGDGWTGEATLTGLLVSSDAGCSGRYLLTVE